MILPIKENSQDLKIKNQKGIPVCTNNFNLLILALTRTFPEFG